MGFLIFVIVLGALAEYGRKKHLEKHGISLREYYRGEKEWPDDSPTGHS